MVHAFNRQPQPCILLQLACIKCGPVRMALPPQDATPTVECPYCFKPAKARKLGEGQTLRTLPYFECESSLVKMAQLPPKLKGSRELIPGQIVIYCQEEHILHFAAVGQIHTNRASLSKNGDPSISFIIAGEETAPIPHISAAPECPPYWCYPYEMPKPKKKGAA